MNHPDPLPRRQQAVGRWGEALAAEYLEKQGWTVLERNARTPFGEIDLVAKQGIDLVFVEVKTRTGGNFGLPEEAVTTRKRAHLCQSAAAYMQAHPELGESWRIDVIAIRGRPGPVPAEILHFENAVS